MSGKELVDRIMMAVIDCPHTITADAIVLGPAAMRQGNATYQLYERLKLALNTPPQPIDETVTEEATE